MRRRISKFDLIAQVGPYITIKVEPTRASGLSTQKKNNSHDVSRKRDKKRE